MKSKSKLSLKNKLEKVGIKDLRLPPLLQMEPERNNLEPSTNNISTSMANQGIFTTHSGFYSLTSTSN